MSLFDALMRAADNNDLALITSLIAQHDKSDFQSEHSGQPNALDKAVMNNNIDCVQELIKVYDPRDDGSYVLLLAASRGYLEITKFLLPLCDPADYSQALSQSISVHGNPCFDALFEHIHIDYHKNHELLQWASYFQNQHAFDALYELVDVEAALREMKIRKWDHEEKQMLRARMKIDQERNILEQETRDIPSKNTTIKKM